MTLITTVDRLRRLKEVAQWVYHTADLSYGREEYRDLCCGNPDLADPRADSSVSPPAVALPTLAAAVDGAEARRCNVVSREAAV